MQIVGLWISNCSSDEKGNREALFAEYANGLIGCSVKFDEKTNTVARCTLAQNFKNKEVTQKVLSDSQVVPGPFTAYVAPAEKIAAVQTHKLPFEHKEDVKTQLAVVQDNGILGDLKAENKLKCPDFINKANKKEKGYERSWTLVGSCNRQRDGIVNGLPAFDKGGKCYQRNTWCSPKDGLWAYDREYQTYDEVYHIKPVPTPIAQNSELKDDESVKCPKYVNTKLVKVQYKDEERPTGWYRAASQCDYKGDFKTPRPFALKGACYNRLIYCTKEGVLYYKDRQFKTFAEDTTEAQEKK